jgi:tetratricopeptide (TPR) repeat protein
VYDSEVRRKQFVEPPDPTTAQTLDDLTAQLRLLKIWAGNPSYATIVLRINSACRSPGPRLNDGRPTSRTTVADCFKIGRRRPTETLVLAIVGVLNPDDTYVGQWRNTLRTISGKATAATFATAQDSLPDDSEEFAGRGHELREIVDGPGAAPTVVIEGMAGVGKTRLAVRAAHQLLRRQQFDHVLFVGLRGFHPDPGQPPVSAAAVLDAFLRLLGVPGHRIPYAVDRRAELYRARLADKTTLIVLDDAATTEQVRPLLPEGSAGMTLVTTRRSLTGLANARRVTLDVLEPQEAIDLLRRVVGDHRIDADPDTATQICELSGRLPLALGLTARRMKANFGWSLADHRDRLAARRHHLQLDDVLQASLSLSYDSLDSHHQLLLRRLALHPGPHIDATAAAALDDTEPGVVARNLDHLLANHLLHQRTPGRYELHDLVRAYAMSLALDTDRDADRRRAVTRLLNHYLAGATAATALNFPDEARRRPGTLQTPGPGMTFPDRAAARRWLDAEQPNLFATAVHAAVEQPHYTAQLSIALHRHIRSSGRYSDLLALHELGLTAAERCEHPMTMAWVTYHLGTACLRTGQYGRAGVHLRKALAMFRRADNQVGEGDALHNLALVDRQAGRYRQAITRFQQARTIRLVTGDRLGEARSLINLGVLCQMSGRYPQATAHHQRAMALFVEFGQPGGQALALQNLGVVHQLTGRYPQALDHLQRAVTMYQEQHDYGGQAHALVDLGTVYRLLGDYDQAMCHHQQATTLSRQRGDLYVEAYALNATALVHRRLGDHDQAARLHAQALEFYRESADPAGQAEAWNGLAEARLAADDPTGALDAFGSALEHAVAIGDQRQIARAHSGRGDAQHRSGDLHQARLDWRHALALSENLESTRTTEIRNRLSTLDEAQPSR